MWYLFRKTIGLFIVAFGLGLVLVLVLPYWSWIFCLSAICILVGLCWLFC